MKRKTAYWNKWREYHKDDMWGRFLDWLDNRKKIKKTIKNFKRDVMKDANSKLNRWKKKHEN